MCWGLHDMQWKWCNKAKHFWPSESQQHDNNADMSLKSLHDNPSLLSAHVSCLKVDRTRGNSPQMASTPLSPLLLFALNELTMHPPWLLLKTMGRCLYLVNFLKDIVTTTSKIFLDWHCLIIIIMLRKENLTVGFHRRLCWIFPTPHATSLNGTCLTQPLPQSTIWAPLLFQRHSTAAGLTSIRKLCEFFCLRKKYYGSVVGKCFYNPAGCMVSDPH